MRKNKEKKLKLFLIIAFLIVALAIPMTVNAASKIKMSKSSITLIKGKSYKLKVTGTKKKIVWTSSNAKIATVTSQGTVKGINKGNCRIYAKVGGKKYSCRVTVTQPVTKIKLNKTSIKIEKGKTYTLKVNITPSSANNKTVTWKSSNNKIATVTVKGVVKGVKSGTVTITAITKDGSGKKASCKVIVKNPPCKHKHTVIKGKYEAKCNATGYTGDTYCTDCGVKISKGKIIPKNNQHKNAYILNKRDATYYEEGYTGDIYCPDCFTIISWGKVIPIRTDYLIINITKDNWKTYFEFVDEPRFWINGFGELVRLDIYQCLVLKPQYREKVITDFCHGVLESETYIGNLECKLDIPNKSYKLGKVISAEWHTGSDNIKDLTQSSIDQFEHNRDFKSIPVFYLPNLSAFVEAENQTVIHGYTLDFNIVRIQGQLYFEK